MTKYLPVGPLQAIAKVMIGESGREFTSEEFGDVVGFSSRAVARWKTSGQLLWQHADTAAVRMGLHPLLIWGDDWMALDAGIINGTDRRSLALIKRDLEKLDERERVA